MDGDYISRVINLADDSLFGSSIHINDDRDLYGGITFVYTLRMPVTGVIQILNDETIKQEIIGISKPKDTH